MKSTIFYLLFLGSSFTNLKGQSVGLFGGINRSSYYDFNQNDYGGHNRTSFYGAYGYSLGICIKDILIDSVPYRFDLSLNNYNGKINSTSGGMGGSTTTDAQINKCVIGIGIYPVNIKFHKKLKIGIGCALNYLLNDKTTTFRSYWGISTATNGIVVGNNTTTKVNPKMDFGICCHLSYDISILNNFYVVPQYQFYKGFMGVKNIQSSIGSFHQYIAVGLIKRLK